MTLLTKAVLGCAACASLGTVLAATLAAQSVKLIATVFDEKTGKPIEDLKAENFSVLDGKRPLQVVSAEYKDSLLDLMVLVDASLIGEMVAPMGSSFVAGLGEKEQMAIVAFDSSAELIQDFTSSKQLLRQSLTRIRYGNNPRILDALYATLDGGFQNTVARRVIVILSAGAEGDSRTRLNEVLALARRRSVSIFPVFVVGADKSLFRKLAENTGGAYFGAKNLKLNPKELSELVYSVLRKYYLLELAGAYTLGQELEVEIVGLPNSKMRVRASALAME
jgi:VWFA-related protein